MFVKQLSVFIENKAGRLAEVTRILGENGINIHALSIADTTDFGILRLIVSDDEKACEVLKDAGMAVKITEVVAVPLEHKPGGLSEVLEKLNKLSISIEYMYAFVSRSEASRAMVILRLNQQNEGVERMKAAGIEIMESDIINTLN